MVLPAPPPSFLHLLCLMVKRLKLGYQVWHLIPPPFSPPSQSHMSSGGHLAIICIKGWGLGLVSSIVLDIALGPYLETISIYSLEIKLHSADNNETFFFGAHYNATVKRGAFFKFYCSTKF